MVMLHAVVVLCYVVLWLGYAVMCYDCAGSD